MLILALDTTTAAGSVALAEGDRLLEVAPIDPLQPIATRVPRDLIALLERHAAPLRSIEAFAVATGPGSFTGLRIGIAAMQGLALANRKPLIGVSSFEAFAALAPEPRLRVAVWIDAWRGEVYGSLYTKSAEVSGSAGTEIVAPQVAPPETLLRSTARLNATDLVFIGDGAVKYRNQIPGRVIEPTPLIAGAIARLAHARLAAGEAPQPHSIRPLYVRRPDAELARERK
jgi:tRNA threonylcarbamoyladenosine biosynthesis protein TsaB